MLAHTQRITAKKEESSTIINPAYPSALLKWMGMLERSPHFLTCAECHPQCPDFSFFSLLGSFAKRAGKIPVFGHFHKKSVLLLAIFYTLFPSFVCHSSTLSSFPLLLLVIERERDSLTVTTPSLLSDIKQDGFVDYQGELIMTLIEAWYFKQNWVSIGCIV